MRDRRRHVRQMLHFLSDRRCKKLKDIKQALVSEFIATQGHLKPRTVSLVTCNVRSFLRYLYMEGIVIHDLSAHVPKVRIRRDEDIPNVWKQEDIERLHGSVDRSTVRGKRDYAILLLASRLGMRVGDIKRLRLEHIRWDEARIEMPQSKTGEPLLLPLTEEVGWALIDYLRNGRPDSAHREVFLGLQAPYAPFAPINGNLYHVVSHYREPEKIKGGQERGRGLHSLRHTMASNLLAEGVGLETIAGILGHRSLDTTRIYTKVDIRGLRSVALDPEEVGHV